MWNAQSDRSTPFTVAVWTRLYVVPIAVASLVLAILIPGHSAAQYASLVGPDGSIDLNRYYTASENDRIMHELHALYPELTELYEIGRSFKGAPLMMIEVTNEATGPADDKPALYVDGGIHSGELTASAVALHTLVYLLQGYGSDPQVTALLDDRAFYIRPKFNPDGSDLALIHDVALRSTVRPVDDDEDGMVDEDPAEDLDGDGWITQMRVVDPNGDWYADPDDRRIMLRVGSDEVPAGAQRYRTMSEGIDNDADGRLNEDGIGGLDMNRNFPRNWELTYLQPGAGEFPLSEPETYAAVRFVQDHPNITGIFHGHTSGGFVYRLPSASAPSLFPKDDLDLIIYLGEEYTRSTGRPVRPSATHPTEHRYGTFISWGYWDQGVVGWVPEFSPGPEAWVTDYNGDGEIDVFEEFRYNDEELGGRYFSNWTEVTHPELGAVEVGGWHSKFWGQNPPAEHLEEETAQQLPWIFYLLEQSPVLAMDSPTVRPIGGGLYEVTATVRNVGFLPTSLTGRGAVGRMGPGGVARNVIVRPVHVSLEIESGTILEGERRQNVGHLRGSGPYIDNVGPAERTVTWRVRADGPDASIRVMGRSVKGGTVQSDRIALGMESR